MCIEDEEVHNDTVSSTTGCLPQVHRNNLRFITVASDEFWVVINVVVVVFYFLMPHSETRVHSYLKLIEP